MLKSIVRLRTVVFCCKMETRHGTEKEEGGVLHGKKGQVLVRNAKRDCGQETGGVKREFLAGTDSFLSDAKSLMRRSVHR